MITFIKIASSRKNEIVLNELTTTVKMCAIQYLFRRICLSIVQSLCKFVKTKDLMEQARSKGPNFLNRNTP